MVPALYNTISAAATRGRFAYYQVRYMKWEVQGLLRHELQDNAIVPALAGFSEHVTVVG